MNSTNLNQINKVRVSWIIRVQVGLYNPLGQLLYILHARDTQRRDRVIRLHLLVLNGSVRALPERRRHQNAAVPFVDAPAGASSERARRVLDLELIAPLQVHVEGVRRGEVVALQAVVECGAVGLGHGQVQLRNHSLMGLGVGELEYLQHNRVWELPRTKKRVIKCV